MALYKISLALALLSGFALPSLANTGGQQGLLDPIISVLPDLPSPGNTNPNPNANANFNVNVNVNIGSSQQEYLEPMNAARAEVNAPALTWDNKVAAFAQDYANKRKADCELAHSNSEQYGENIAWGSGDLSVAEAVKMWIDEKSGFDPISNTCSIDQCGHYTQVVWSNTQRVGCAKVTCNNGGTFITCNYDPPGNVIGERPF